MATNYFEAPSTGSYEQYRGKADGALFEHGLFSFTTTGTTVAVPTNFSKVIAAVVTSTETLGYNETLFCDCTVRTSSSYSPGQYVNVQRISNATYDEYHFAIDEDQIASNDLGTTPLMIAPAAATLTALEFYKGTAFGGGTVTFDLEKVGSANYYLNGGAVTNTAASTDTYTSFDAATVADGDVIQANTNGGTTSGPGDMCISMSMTKTAPSYTSGLTFSYMFIGLY
jgi:hypothetical protein